jgi:hypothetical protein
VGRRSLRTAKRPALAARGVVLLHCQEGCSEDVALMLAGGLHWYGGLGPEESLKAVEQAMGQQVGGCPGRCLGQ